MTKTQRVVWCAAFIAGGIASIAGTVLALLDLPRPLTATIPPLPLIVAVRYTLEAAAVALLPFLSMFLFTGAVAAAGAVTDAWGADLY
jgi:hypothetical protein